VQLRGQAPLLMFLNHADGERRVSLDGAKRDLITGVEHEQSIRLAPFGVALLAPVRAAVETA
jgi:hypothetical protein